MPWYESQGSDKMGNFPDPQSKSPFSTMAPATAFPCPQRNLVALCSTISAPQSNGRIRYGVACQHVARVCGGQDNASPLARAVQTNRSVVDNHRETVAMCHFHQGLQIHDNATRICDDFAKDSFCVFIDFVFDRRHVVGISKSGFPTELSVTTKNK